MGLVYGANGKTLMRVNKRGYVEVKKRVPGGHIYARAHRIIWEYVNGPIPHGMEINHINGVKTDNRITNLELVTPSENMRHAARTGLWVRASFAGEGNGRAKLTYTQVENIRVSTNAAAQLAREYGVAPTTIRDIRKGRKWSLPIHSELARAALAAATGERP